MHCAGTFLITSDAKLPNSLLKEEGHFQKKQVKKGSGKKSIAAAGVNVVSRECVDEMIALLRSASLESESTGCCGASSAFAVIASGLKDGRPDVKNIRDFFDCGRPRPRAIKALIGGGDTLAKLWKLPRESRHGISTEEREDLVHDLAEAALRTFYTESNLSFVETHWGDIQPILRDRRHSDDVETNRRLEMLTHRSSPDLFVADYSNDDITHTLIPHTSSTRKRLLLEYKDLDAASRLSVWNNFLTSHNAAQAAARLSPPPKAPTTAAKSYGSARALNKCRTNSATPSAANGTTISAEAASKATRAGLMSSKTSFIFFHSTSGKAVLVSKSPSTMCYSGLLGPERLGAYRCRR
ncbi:uncharacterized protein MYCGRDRAFT_97549 [Zymoseptoria tritici IPO323]|uniref:Uncharacterized protein n=1 Tax=Zymoseptoria tritici (strain CBS 115943 / IPO323) TaxID=336722 RepID=F9XQK4_ZYMTI|nr:uncharacterized protein MYCGRDRAFT_97549 [Zymoseptoria tritici IPO323]EGP82476.1 hypothetical protein MYCGRDRAFT_97549 [Zymoseptoria tritici IPO323]